MTKDEALKLALEALENNRQTHHYCEDTWYSCPKHEDGCANESEGDECNCGADKANAEIDKAITAIKEALAQPEQKSVAMADYMALTEKYVALKAAQPEQEPVAKYSDIVSDGGLDPRNTTTPQRTDEEEYLSKAYRLANELRCHLAIAPAPQRTWVGLTDEEIAEVAVKTQDGISPRDDTLRFAIAIEAKLKEKNT